MGRGFIRLIFIPNRKKPLTALEIAKLTKLPRHIVSVRAARSKVTKDYQGQTCAVLTEKDLKPPLVRKSNGKRYIVKLNEGEVKVLSRVKGRTKAEIEALGVLKRAIRPKPDAVAIWNEMVRKKRS